MSVIELEAELFRLVEAQSGFQARIQQLEQAKADLYQKLNEARKAAQEKPANAEGK